MPGLWEDTYPFGVVLVLRRVQRKALGEVQPTALRSMQGKPQALPDGRLLSRMRQHLARGDPSEVEAMKRHIQSAIYQAMLVLETAERRMKTPHRVKALHLEAAIRRLHQALEVLTLLRAQLADQEEAKRTNPRGWVRTRLVQSLLDRTDVAFEAVRASFQDIPRGEIRAALDEGVASGRLRVRQTSMGMLWSGAGAKPDWPTRVLGLLRDHPEGLPRTEIERHLCTSQSTVARALQDLTQRDLVRREYRSSGPRGGRRADLLRMAWVANTNERTTSK